MHNALKKTGLRSRFELPEWLRGPGAAEKSAGAAAVGSVRNGVTA